MSGEITKEMLDDKESAPNPERDIVVIGNKYPIQVLITDIEMPFMSMVTFMVKWAVAAIPAIIILFIIAGISYGALTAALIRKI